MGVFAGPDVSESGLVLALDAANSKGFDDDENLLTYSTFIFSSINTHPTGWTGFNPGRIVRSIGQSPDGTDAAIVGKQFNNSGGFRPSTAITLLASTTYTVSFYARKPTDSELTLFLSYFATNDATSQPYAKGVKIRYDDTDTSTGSTGSTSFTLADSWQRFTYTFNSGSDTIIRPNFTSLTIADAYDPTGLFVIASIQIEKSDTASPYYATTGTAKNRGTTLIDMTGRGNTGTLTNGPTYSSTNGGTIVFDGTNDVVTFPNNTISTTSGITVEVWFKTSSGTKYQDIFDLADAYGIWITTNYPSVGTGKITASFNTTTGIMSVNYSVDTWYQVVISGSGTSNTLYLNGVGVSTASQTVATSINLNTARIGNVDGDRAAEYFVGNIASLKLYNKALTAAEIQKNFNATRGRFGI